MKNSGTGEAPRHIPDRESLTVEFKSDRDRLPDRDLVAAVICLANSEGSDVFVGVDLFRVPVPNYDRRAFRETLVNALLHRDYTRLGAIMSSGLGKGS